MTFSIIVPCFNLAPWIRSCLDSVAAQSFSDWECIVVDDGSTDGSGQILDDFGFKVIHQPNAGEGGARNAGLAVAQGEWVIFLDGDDRLAPGALERIAKIIGKHPNEDLIKFGYDEFEEGGPIPPADAARAPRLRVVDISRQISEADYFVYVWQFAFRRTMIADMRFGSQRRGADRLFIISLLCSRAKSFVATDDVCYHYRQRAGSAMHGPASVQVLKDELSHRVDVIGMMDACGKEIRYRNSEWLEEYCVRTYHERVWEKSGGRFVHDAAARRELMGWYRRELPRLCRARDLSARAKFACRLHGFAFRCFGARFVAFNYPILLDRLAIVICNPSRIFRSIRLRSLKRCRQDEDWSLVIKPHAGLLSVDLGELWHYRDLYLMLVKRDAVIWYKQTVLGPLWFFIQPILTTVTYMVVFGGIAKIPTDGVPQPVFYLAGICLWQYFADCLTKTSATFSANAGVFGKVYFPRLVVPLAICTSNLIRFGIQFALFLIVYAYFFVTGANVHLTWAVALVPLCVALIAAFALGFGIVFSSMTTKYRDLQFLLGFLVQLWMYATPVIYPLSTITDERLKFVMMANPVTGVVEAFKYGLLGAGSFSWGMIGYSAAFATVLLAVGIVVFNRVQRSFIDTV